MDVKSQRQKGRDGALSALNVAIDALNHMKDMSGSIAPAQVAFGSVSVLLTIIKVPSPLFCGDNLPIHVNPGLYGQRTELRRTRAQLCGYL